MKYILIFICLFMALPVLGQQLPNERKGELQQILDREHLVEQNRKTYRIKKRNISDSIITLVCDTVVFRFYIPKLASVRTKDIKISLKYQKGLVEILKLYSAGKTVLNIDQIDAYTESLLTGALSSGKAERIQVNDEAVMNYQCTSYGFSRKNKTVAFSLCNKEGKLFWAHTDVICWGVKFR